MVSSIICLLDFLKSSDIDTMTFHTSKIKHALLLLLLNHNMTDTYHLPPFYSLTAHEGILGSHGLNFSLFLASHGIHLSSFSPSRLRSLCALPQL